MTLNEIPAWSDIESQPWFASLTPEEKQQSLQKWQGDMMQFAKDPKEKFAVAATSKAKARSFFGEEMPDDPIADALQRRQKDLEDIGSRYDAFSKGELEEDDEEVLTLNDTLKGNTPYSVIKGRLFVSPQLVWDKAAYEKVVNEAPVDEDERVLAMSAYDGSKERAAEGVVNSLGYTDEAFRDFAAKGFKEGKSNAAILDEWKANNKLPEGILGSLRGVGRQAYFGLRSGLSGLERAMGGLGGFFGSESAQKYAEESGKEAQSYMQRTLGEGPEFIGELTSGAVSIIPTIAAGAAASFFTEGAALPAAASITAGAIQSAGATQAETYEFYRNQGLDHANALAESRVDGLVSGLITGAITHYAGKLGDKIGLGKGIEGLFSGPASKIASKLTQREISESLKAGAKAVGGSFLQEGSEELLDQAAQDAYSMIKRDPTLTLAEAINNALQAGKVGAVLGGAAEAGKIGLKSLLNSAKFSVPTTEEEEALRAKFEVPAAVEEEIIASPEVQQEEQNVKTAADVVKETAPVAPQTAAVLAGITEEKVGELAADVVVKTGDALATIEAEAPVVATEPPAEEAPPPAEAPAISPKPPVSPAVETAPIGETQPPQGQPVETPTNAAPEIPLEESLRQEPQDRVEVGTPEETGVGDSIQRAAEGEKEVAPREGAYSLETRTNFAKLPASVRGDRFVLSPATGTVFDRMYAQSVTPPAFTRPGQAVRSLNESRYNADVPLPVSLGRSADGADIFTSAADLPPVVIPQQTQSPPTTGAVPTKTLPDGQKVTPRGVAGPVVARDTSKPEQRTPLEYMRKAVGAKFVESVAPGKEEAWWSAKEKQGAPRRYAAGTKMVLEENGRFFVLDLNTNKYKGFGSKREAFLFFKAKDGRWERRYIEVLSGKKLDPLSRIDHKIAVDNAVKNNAPVSAETVDSYGIKLPEGYVKQGELYVYEKTQPLPKDDAAGERGAVAPAPAVEPAPEARPVSQPVQAFRDAVSQMSPTAQAKWTPELRATAEAYLDSGGTTGLQGLSPTQEKIIKRLLDETTRTPEQEEAIRKADAEKLRQEKAKAKKDAEMELQSAYRKPSPFPSEEDVETEIQNAYRASALPPTPGKQIRKIGKGAMESVPVVLDEIAKVIPNIRDLVEVRESVEGEPDAEGFYDPQADKAVVLVDNVYLKPQHGGSQEAALRETIIHELLHRGFAKLRQTNPQLFEQFEAYSLADTNDAQFEALVRRGYSMYSNWKDDPAQNQKAREEIFIRKAVVDLNFKGIEAIKSPTSLASQFFSWLRGLLNKLLGRKVDDEALLHWSRVFLNAAQADFIEKTPGERMHAFTAYHGTPHKVDKFSLSKIGTGEGAQAFGWGLYFAQNKGVAKSYQEVLSGGNRLLINGKTLEDATVNLTPTQIKWAQEVDHYVDEMQEPLERAKGYVREGIEDALERKSFERFASTFGVSDSSGNLYTVEIMPDEDEFLDWDKPLSEQSEKVKNILSPIVEELIQRQIKKLEATPSIAAFGLGKKKLRSYAEEFLAPNLASGMGLYDLVRGLEGNKRGGVTPDDMSRIASEYLASIGIPGIRYLDADSRGKEDGTRNFVIFDENLVKILEENGQVLTPPAESDIRYSLADKDAEYLDAVEAGDSGNDNLSELLREASPSERQAVVDSWIKRNPKAAARMQQAVDEAAANAGYDRMLFHQTHKDNVPKIYESGFRLDILGARASDNEMPDGIFLKPDELNIKVGAANAEDIRQMRLFVRLQNPLIFNNRKELVQFVSAKNPAFSSTQAEFTKTDKAIVSEVDRLEADALSKPAGKEQDDAWARYFNESDVIFEKGRRSLNEIAARARAISTAAVRASADGIIVYNDAGSFGRTTTTVVALDPNQIKSADPVTYDDAGNVIPPSQRFQTVSPDIRYSLGEPPDMQAEADALREVTPSSQALDKFRETFGTPRQDVGQVLGKKEGSVYTQAQVAPLIEYARSMIGFENDANGDPIISHEATQKALNMVANLNGRPGFASQFNVRAAEVFKGKPVDPEIATAVLTQELQVYANRLSASSPKAEDQILKVALTPFYNTQILGSYLSRRIAGRTLQAASMASGETGDARKSREEAEKAVNKEITKQLGDEALPAADGMDKAGVEGGVDAIKDDIPAPADPTLRLLDLAVESLDEVAKAEANAVFDVLLRLGEAEEALERAKKVGSKAMSILTERRTVRELPSTVEELEVLVGNLRIEAAEKLAKLRSSLEGAKPETKKKVKERATKAGGKAKTAPKVSDKEEDPITKEINALAAELGTLSKLDQAGLDVVKQIAKKLVAKFQPAKLDALKDKVEAVVYKYVQNAERLELAEFSEKMTADLDSLGLKKPELQEALVAKAWAYHFAAPTKAVQALTAKMKSAERADRGGPESVANVRKAINGAVNSTEENRDAFVTRLTDQLVALGVEAQTAEAAAKAAFEYRAKQADKKIERVMETLRLGKRRALLKSFQNTKEADRTEEWQRATLKAAFVEAGLTNKQAEKGADKAMQEAEAIFATAEMKVAEIKQRSAQKFLDSLASVEDETPVTKTKQDNLRSVFKDATLDEEFNEAVLMDRFQTLGATEAQAKALVEKVAEVREDKAEALAEAKRKQVNKVIDATYKRIAQLESGTPSEKAKKQESLRNAVGAAIKAKEFDEATFRASVASFGASEPQVETLVQNVKKLRQLGESKPLSKAKLRQFLLSFPKNVLANPEQREALLRAFLTEREYTDAEINRIVPQVLRDFDTGYQKARKAYLDELEKKLKPKQGQKESKQDQQNRKMLNALRSGLADTTSEASVALAKSLGFEAFRPQDDHILSKLDEEMRKLREQDRISDANAKFVQIRDLLNRRRPPRDFMQVAAQGWITSALSSLSNFAVNVWAPLGEAGVRFTSDILRAAATGKIDEIPLYLEAAIQALKSMPPRAKFAFKTDTFTNSVNTLIADMASMKDELQRALNTYRGKDSSKLAKAAAAGRILFTIGDLSRRVLSTVDDTWYTALSSYIGSSNLIKDLRDAKLPKAAVQAIAFHANNDALHQAQAEHATLDAVSQFVESLRGKTEEEIDAGLEYLGLNDASVTQAQADYIQEIVSALQSLRIRSGATGDDLVKRALKEISNFKAAVNVRAVELGQARTKELLATALTEVGQTPQQIEEAQRNYDENAKKAASFGMGLHRVEGVPSYDIMGKAVQIVDAMGRGAVTTSPLLGRMMVGFFGIPLNLLNKSLWFTPYGLGRYFLAKWQMAKNPEEKFYEYSMSSQREMSQRVNEIIIGHTIMAAAFALGAIRDQEDEEGEGLYITLGGPSNKTEYDAWYARGFRKFSFCYKTKDGSVAAMPYGRGMGEVLKMPLMLLGAFDDMRLNKKLGDREDMSSIIEYLNSAAAGIGNQATFLGAKNTVGAFAPDKIGANTASSIAYAVSNLVPFNGLDRSIAALAVGPPDRSRTGAILANIPIARWLATDPAINVFGDKWGNKSDANFAVLWDRQWNQGLIPLNISAPLTGQDKRLYGFIGERLIGPSPALRGALELRNGYVTDKQWYDYSIYRGQALKREMVTQLDRLRRMDDDSLSKAIAELSTKATKKAKDRFKYK